MIFQSDLIIYSAITFWLNDIRKNQYLIDFIVRDLKCYPGLERFADSEADAIRALLENQIFVYLDHRSKDTIKYPNITISMNGASPDMSNQSLGDNFQRLEERYLSTDEEIAGALPRDNVLLGPVTPLSYDPETGEVEFASTVNLSESRVFAGQFLQDSKNKVSYEILIVNNDNSITIQDGLNLDLNDMRITSSNEIYRSKLRTIWMNESYTLSINANEPQDVIRIFMILMSGYIRNKLVTLETRNFQIANISYGPLMEFTANASGGTIYSRDMNLQGRVEHSSVATTQRIVDGIVAEVKLLEMSATPAAFLSNVQAQGWSSALDPDGPLSTASSVDDTSSNSSSSSSSALVTLQSAYSNGRFVNITTGFPVEITGSSGKLLRVLGDMEVTGVIDPAGIEFTPQAVSPFDSSTTRGIWVDSNDDLIFNDSVVENNITQDIQNLQSGLGVLALSRSFTNSTGSNIPKGTPVYSPSPGLIAPAVGTSDLQARIVGITVDAINDGDSGQVAYAGVIENFPGTYTNGAYLWLDQVAGGVVDVPPSIALGYPKGFNQVILGVSNGNDLILQITHFAIL